MTLHETKPNFENGAIPYLNFVDWQNQNHTFSSIAISRGVVFILTGMVRGRTIAGRLCVGGLFPTLGVKPLAGATCSGRG